MEIINMFVWVQNWVSVCPHVHTSSLAWKSDDSYFYQRAKVSLIAKTTSLTPIRQCILDMRIWTVSIWVQIWCRSRMSSPFSKRFRCFYLPFHHMYPVPVLFPGTNFPFAQKLSTPMYYFLMAQGWIFCSTKSNRFFNEQPFIALHFSPGYYYNIRVDGIFV